MLIESQRKIWLDAMIKIVEPVLKNASKKRLREVFPFDFHKDKSSYAMLEALGRSLCGIAPWLELEGLEGEEKILQDNYRVLARKSIDAATDKDSPDYMNFGIEGDQPLVDAAFLSHALVRAPNQLIGKLDERVKTNLVTCLKQTRRIIHNDNNWILFTSMVETALYLLGDTSFDKIRIEYGIHLFELWYKGDGVYGDGDRFHWDYYNSFVIHPMLVDMARIFYDNHPKDKERYRLIMARASRYASILERMIAPDGTYPIIGRSIVYRFGAFQLLSAAALGDYLEEDISPASVRCGLTAVIQRTMASGHMFKEGWLQPGVVGFQPELAEHYINVGSLYLCSTVFLPLGLHPNHRFWADKDEKWTNRKVWDGEIGIIDYAIVL